MAGPGYDFNTIAGNIKSVLTGEVWEVTQLGNLQNLPKKIVSVDGLPKPEIENIEVTYRNKKLYFPKYAATNGQLTIVLLEDADSSVRKELYEKVEKAIKDGVVKEDAKNDSIIGDIVIKVYKHGMKVSRTYTIKGCVIAGIEEELTLPEEGAEAVKITLTINFSDYELSFGG